jgi:formiminoglutamase
VATARRSHAAAWLASASPRPRLVVLGASPASGGEGTAVAFRAALSRLSTLDAEEGRDLAGLEVADWGDPVGKEGPAAAAEIHRLVGSLPGSAVMAVVGASSGVVPTLLQGLAGGVPSRVGVLALGGAAGETEGLIADGVSGERLIHVGSRAFAGDGAGRGTAGAEVVTMETVDEVGAGWVATSALRDLAQRAEWVFLVVDLGVLDSAFAPGCPGAGPGGMTPRQLAAACRASGRHPKVRAAAFVGAGPQSDPAGLTMLNLAAAFLAFASGVASREVPDA